MIPKKILFCADFSENSEPARELAVDYAKTFGAQLLIIHVIDSTFFSTYEDWKGEELNEVLERMKESATVRLESLRAECSQTVGSVETYCRIGSPASEIVALAVEKSAELIVVGTHGRTGVKGLVMGSIARSVLRTAHRPVLIMEAPSGKGESSEGF
ncbi:MAG: universal stress protein [Desulfomonile sp.]